MKKSAVWADLKRALLTHVFLDNFKLLQALFLVETTCLHVGRWRNQFIDLYLTSLLV